MESFWWSHSLLKSWFHAQNGNDCLFVSAEKSYLQRAPKWNLHMVRRLSLMVEVLAPKPSFSPPVPSPTCLFTLSSHCSKLATASSQAEGSSIERGLSPSVWHPCQKVQLLQLSGDFSHGSCMLCESYQSFPSYSFLACHSSMGSSYRTLLLLYLLFWIVHLLFIFIHVF